MGAVLTESDLPGLPLVHRGKVRDLYAAGNDKLVVVTTDRISAFDCILGSGIPDKGRVLTQLSLFWLDLLRPLTPNHLISPHVDDFPAEFHPFREQIQGRSMLVKRARMIDIECVARGYLAGSGWKEYQASRTVCGIPLPAHLTESARLPEPLFTPATKAAAGHDENISFEECSRRIGASLAERLRDLTLAIYQKASDFALTRGIILADTKFEFGFIESNLVLCDEVLTPDSSRFWPADLYEAGRPQLSFDKQYVRDYLETLTWNKRPPAPALPDEVVARTADKYREAFLKLTGRPL